MEEIIPAYFYLISADGAAHLLEYLDGEEIEPVISQSVRISSAPAIVRGALYAVLRYVLGWRRMATIVRQGGAKSVSNVWKKQYEKKVLRREWIKTWRSHKLDVLITPGEGFKSAI